MAKMERPIRIVKYTPLSKNWDRTVGFLAMWFQEEIGFTHQQLFTRDMLFRVEPTSSGKFHEVTCQGPEGREEVKVMSDRLYRALIDYSCIRSWRMPQNLVFFVGAVGAPFCPRDYKRYVQEG